MFLNPRHSCQGGHPKNHLNSILTRTTDSPIYHRLAVATSWPKTFTLQEADKLARGEFHEELEDSKPGGDPTIDPDAVNKTIFVGNREQLYEEQQFEDAIRDV